MSQYIMEEASLCGRRKNEEMDVRSRRDTESSPDRAKVRIQPRVKPIERVHVVYYISRNGQLEHPHHMEVTRSANQHLRLRDVIDRLTALRGEGMPSLYSWSCKRSYKNGYVWNDLAENDIIYPAEGAEYVLKGSELVESCSESFRQLNLSNRQLIEEPKCKKVYVIRNKGHQETEKTRHIEEQEYEEEEEEEEEYEDEEKTSFTSSTTTNSRCSRGVSTDELEDHEGHQNPTKSTQRDSSPPSESAKISDKPKCQSSNTSKRFADGDPVRMESEPGRNSVLFQLIACGNFAGSKAKTVGNSKPPALKNSVIRTSSDLHKGVLCKTAMKVVQEDIINCMSENPRFGNLQSEEKEYFSGSIVESMSEDRVLSEPALKRSNSFKEERSAMAVLEVGEGEAVESRKRDKAVRAKCIPIKKPSSSKQHKK